MCHAKECQSEYLDVNSDRAKCIRSIRNLVDRNMEVYMSDQDHNILKIDDNIEIQKLLLDRQRLEQDKELKLKELEIQAKQAAKVQWTAPIIVAVIGGFIGLLSNFWSSYQNLALERQKQEGTLILEAIKTGQTREASANLIFLDNAKLIHLTTEQRQPLEQKAGKNPLPSLPKIGGDRDLEGEKHLNKIKEFLQRWGLKL